MPIAASLVPIVICLISRKAHKNLQVIKSQALWQIFRIPARSVTGKAQESLRENVYERQEKVKEISDLAEIELVKAHMEAKAAWDAGAGEKEMDPFLSHIRNAQWYWDYSAASHGASFHSPLEVSRIIGLSISEAQEARVEFAGILNRHGKNQEIPYPDIASKDKAQKFIGLQMDQLKKEKQEFIKNVIPGWDRKAKEREDKWEKPEK